MVKMKKIYKKLTKEQKERGVIFSSCLSIAKTELLSDTIHEVLKETEKGNEQIERLLNDRFFNASHWKYNIVRR